MEKPKIVEHIKEYREKLYQELAQKAMDALGFGMCVGVIEQDKQVVVIDNE